MSRILAALIGLGLMAQSAVTQDVADSSGAHDSLALTLGQRVRITSREHQLHKQVGTIIGLRMDSLTVQRGVVDPRFISAVDTLVLARNDIDTFEVSRGVSRRTGRAALIGLSSGALLGAVLGFATYEECVPKQFLDCLLAPESATQQAMLTGTALGLIGAGIGALVGAKQERWERLGVAHAAGISVQPVRHGGIGLGLKVRF